MFSHAAKIFTLNGFDIKVDPSWLILAALITWSLSQHYFPQELPAATSGIHLTIGVIATLGMFASLLLHELAHSIVARRLGVPVKSITLFIFGGVAELGAEPASARTELYVATVGPVASLGLSAVFWCFAVIANLVTAPDAIVALISYLALVNLVLAVFNIIPAFPLDGGRILRAYLWHKGGDALAATKIATQSGVIFAYILMSLGILVLFEGALAQGLWWLMIGVFLLMAARSSYLWQLAQVAFDGKNVASLMTREPITVEPDTTLAELLDQFMIRHGITFMPVMEGPVLLGHIDRTVLSRIDREHWGNTKVGDVFVSLDDDATVAPNTSAKALLDRIAKTGRRKFMVATDHQLLGIITLSDLTQHLGSAAAQIDSKKTRLSTNCRGGGAICKAQSTIN